MKNKRNSLPGSKFHLKTDYFFISCSRNVWRFNFVRHCSKETMKFDAFISRMNDVKSEKKSFQSIVKKGFCTHCLFEMFYCSEVVNYFFLMNFTTLALASSQLGFMALNRQSRLKQWALIDTSVLRTLLSTHKNIIALPASKACE